MFYVASRDLLVVNKVLEARAWPRNFYIEMASRCRRLIHESGYEAVGMAALTEALNIIGAAVRIYGAPLRCQVRCYAS